MVVVWGLLALAVAPWLIGVGYRGEGFSFLIEVFAGRVDHSVDYYLDAWYALATRVTLVALALGSLGYLDWRFPELLRSSWARSGMLGGLFAWIVLDRLGAVNDPLMGWHHERMHETGAMARNFAELRPNILFPQIDWGGAGPGYIEEAFQLYTYIVSLLYRVFGVHEAIGRGLNLVLFTAIGLLLFRLVSRLYDQRGGLFSLFFFAASPLGMYYGRNLVPDILILFWAVLALYLFTRWSDDGSSWAFWGSAVAIALCSLQKPVNLYLGLPLLYLAYRRLGTSLFARPALWGYAAVVFAPTVAWYWYSHTLWTEYGNTAGIWGEGFSKLGTAEIWSDPTFYRTMGERIAYQVTTPLGVAPFVLGLLVRPRSGNRVFHFWALGFAVAIMLSAGAQLPHNYYQIPLIPIAAVFMGVAVSSVWDSRVLGSPRLVRGVLVLFMGALVWRAELEMTRSFAIPAYQTTEIAFGRRLGELSQPGDLVVVGSRFYRGTAVADAVCCRRREVDGRYFASDAVELYESHRKGWSIHQEDWNMETVEYLRAKGAAYFGTWEAEALARNAPFLDSLQAKYPALERTSAWVIHPLRGE